MLLTDKYSPKKLDDLQGNDNVKSRVRQWMLNWLANKPSRPLLLWGPPGIGKTAMTYALAKEYDLDVLEMNSSELRNKKRIIQVIQGATLAGSLTGNAKIILIDDIDNIQSRKDFGGASAIVSILRDCQSPVILTAANAWDRKLSGIRGECESLEMKRIGKLAVNKVLEKIVTAENLKTPKVTLDSIAQASNGDVRSAINDLQAMHTGSRDREKDIFQRVRKLFKATTFKEAKESIAGGVDLDIFKLWVDENIPIEYDDPLDVAAAYSQLSRADIYEGRIRRTYWKFLRYALDLETAGVALAKQKPYRKFTRYQFPGYLRSMSSSMQRRAMLKKIGLKIGAVVHANRREALHYLPLLREMSKGNEDQLMKLYDLEEDELAFIMETSPRKIRTRKK